MVWFYRTQLCYFLLQLALILLRVCEVLAIRKKNGKFTTVKWNKMYLVFFLFDRQIYYLATIIIAKHFNKYRIKLKRFYGIASSAIILVKL